MRKKLYKSGKMWVAAFAAMAFFGSQQVNADSNTSTSTQQNVLSPSTTSANTQQADSNQSTANANTQQVDTSQSTTNTNTQQGGSSQSAGLINGLDGNYLTDSNGKTQFILKSTNKPVTGLQIISGFTQYYDPSTGYQVKGEWKTIGNASYWFDYQGGNAVKGIQTIGNNIFGFDQFGKQVKGGFLTSDSGITYYFDSLGNTVSGLQTINGEKYFLNTDGSVFKNGQKIVDNVTYYFDNTDGRATIVNSSVNTVNTISTTDFSAHNQIVSTTSTNAIDNISGFITADSWYQPKDILQNGENWQPSQSTDRRPLLMTWWPDKSTEVAYVNFMINQGIVQLTPVNSVDTLQTVLTTDVQSIQIAIEKRIAAEKSTVWLKNLIDQFIVTQSQWNATSEKPSLNGYDDGFQHGSLVYQNSSETPWANSNFRYLNRTPQNQTGTATTLNYGTLGGYEMLLANDVDNSNPVVQAEQLNWLYYLMNFGSITANDSSANFDSYRIDAPDNVDADLLQIAADYMKQAYGVDKNDATANKHLSILENWNSSDYQYIADKGSNQLTMDTKAQNQLIYSLTTSPSTRASMKRFLEWYNVDRSVDNTENTATPNYSFLRSHDNQVQSVIAQIIADQYTDVEPYQPTQEQLDSAFKIYDQDEWSATKRYTMYNIPAAYAMLLTNKDTVPRVYYGDLYTDDGQYMAKETPYYDAITSLLQDRVKYVAGGQTTSNSILDTDTNTTFDSDDVLTTVRFGKGLMNSTDVDSSGNTQRTDGMGVVISNNPNIQLSGNQRIVLHMGASHKNQLFRASLLSTKDGLQVYQSDSGAPTLMTDANGDLVFDSSWIYGISTAQVSGYLAVWVPVGAEDDQDVRSLSDASQETSTDGKILHSNASLDSNVIYEGFSNFSSMPTTNSEYANVKIAANANLFKSWGITSFEFAPQYRSSTDTSFLDSIVKNGYSFTDKYDLGFNNADGTANPTKYGTADQLRDALKAIHAAGMQAMADWVPDQLYNLPGKEAVTVTRTDMFGNPVTQRDLNNFVYIVNTLGSGTDYQSVYGGAFLEELKKKYPTLFETKQISTGLPIDGDERITQWSAKYLNGTNILGRGAGYVLKDSATSQYFKIASDGSSLLPKQLLNTTYTIGFVKDSIGTKYYSYNGYQAIDNFVQYLGNTYYFDQNGYMLFGQQNIDGKWYLFDNTGAMQYGRQYIADDNKWVLYDRGNGEMKYGQQYDQGNWYLFSTADGSMQYGRQYIADQNKWVLYDRNDGTMQYGQQLDQGHWYLFSLADGSMQYGRQYIADQNKWVLYDRNDGTMQYGQQFDQGHWYLFDTATGAMQYGRQYLADQNKWVLYNRNDGTMQYGQQFDQGNWYLFDTLSGAMQYGRQYISSENKWVLYDRNDGTMKYGEQYDQGNWYLFDTMTGAMQYGTHYLNGSKKWATYNTQTGIII
ncbi:Glucan-binding domain (YG repeat) [Fructobacillus tropaeoli]|uniref:glycoside hydrolase family 70 protein n=1 Tax=Fructobacillus tropaeoli TaxID=709323 RepID=UPI002D9E7035|nr:Glucan-binding domain (YG repeat) [Fructobacillus tropaeoli]